MLLFYSHNYELDSAPYYNFIKAYGDSASGDYEDISQEEQTNIVKSYLEVMAKNMNQMKKSPSDIFFTDEKGLISPDNFVDGLQALDISDIQKDHLILMLESLQFDADSSKSYINLQELSEILQQFGLNVENEKSSNSSGHIRKISLLETEINYEYSEDSPDKNLQFLSRPLSEASPFTDMTESLAKGSSINESRISQDKTPSLKKIVAAINEKKSDSDISDISSSRNTKNMTLMELEKSKSDLGSVKKTEIHAEYESSFEDFEEDKIDAKEINQIVHFESSKESNGTKSSKNPDLFTGTDTVVSNIDTTNLKDLLDSKFNKQSSKESSKSSIDSYIYNDKYESGNPFKIANEFTSSNSLEKDVFSFSHIANIKEECSDIKQITEISKEELITNKDFRFETHSSKKSAEDCSKSIESNAPEHENSLRNDISLNANMRGSVTIWSELESEYQDSQKDFRTPMKSIEGATISDPQTLINKQSLTYSSSSSNSSKEESKESIKISKSNENLEITKIFTTQTEKNDILLYSIENLNPENKESEIVEAINNKDSIKYVENLDSKNGKALNFEPDIEPIRSVKSNSSIESSSPSFEQKNIKQKVSKPNHENGLPKGKKETSDIDSNSESSDFEIENY